MSDWHQIDDLFYESQTLRTVMREEYGAGLDCFDPCPVLWSAEIVAERISPKVAKRELAALNAIRKMNGVPSACFEYGHQLF